MSFGIRASGVSLSKTASRQQSALLLATAAVMGSLLSPKAGLAGTNGTYSNITSGGLWSNSANWTGSTIANGQDGIADFSTLTLPANNTVHLDTARTIGGLKFGDHSNTYNWTLDNNSSVANTLTLSTSTGIAPVINVVNQSATIGASIVGTQGFTLAGGGILTLSGNNSYTGTTNVSNGTLVLSSTSTVTSSPTAGAVVDLDPTLSTINTSSGTVNFVSDLSTAGTNFATNTSSPGAVTLSTINGHRALSFNGASGLRVANYRAATSPETVFVVMNPSDIVSGGALVGADAGGGNDGLELRLSNSKMLALREGLTPYAQSNNVSAGTLSVVAYAFNSSGGTYYINGSTAGTTVGPTLAGSNPLTIGYQKSYGNPQDYFNGTLGTVLIYNSVLSSSQISATANFLASEYAASSTTLGTTLVNLSTANSNLALAGGTQSVSSLSGVTGSNVYLGSGILSVGSDGTSTVFAGNISDTGTGAVGVGGSLIKVGAGTLNLSGGVNNTGGIAVNAGLLLVSGSYATSGPTTVTGGTLSITGPDSDTGSHSVNNGILSISGNNTTTGNYAIGSTGTLVLAGSSAASGAISISNGGLLTLVANSSNTDGSGNSSAIGAPSGVVYANAAITNIQLLSDNNATFVNAQPTGGTGGGTTLNFNVDHLTAGTNKTLTLGSAGFATYQTTINVASSSGYTLLIPSITSANGAYVTLNASTGNLSIPGGVTGVTTLTVKGAGNTTLGAVSGTGPLVKSGSGTLLLTGSNSYTGLTSITGGTLALGSSGLLAGTPGIVISSGATFDISAVPSFTLASSSQSLTGSGTINGSYNHSVGVLAAGISPAIGTLNINGNLTLAGGTVDVSISGSNNSTGGLANDLINVTGGLNLVGNNTLTLGAVSPTLPSGTTWTVLSYNASAGLTGTGTLNVSTSAFAVIEDTVHGLIELKYLTGAVGADLWTGSASTNWDTSTPNFVPSGSTSPISFTNGDNAIFDDTSTVTNVTLSSTLLPGSVTVNSNNSNYTFSGTGSIGGSASLIKQGISVLTINSSNSYTGTTNISGGVLINAVSSGSGIGTGPLIVGPGATLVIGNATSGGNPADGSLALRNSSITDNGTIVYNGSDYNYFSVPVTGTGGINVSAGTLGIGSVNTYTGPVNIIGSTAAFIAYEDTSFGVNGTVTVDNGGSIIVPYGPRTFSNPFNLSGQAISVYNSAGLVTITGPVTLNDANTTFALENPLTLTNTLTATNNQSVLVVGGSTLTLGGNVALGTGTLGSQGAIAFAPPASTKITVSTGGIVDVIGEASVLQLGPGTTVLNGSNSYSGGTNVAGGTLVFNAPYALPNFSALTISTGATAQVANYSGGLKNTLFASSLTIASGGKLDLGNNDLVVQNGSLTTLTALVASGYANSSSGIVSSKAAADTTHLHALGVILNTADGSSTLYGGTLPAFDGASQSAASDVLIKYTYVGDANLDGKVDGSDYSLVDASYLAEKSSGTPATGWFNGDFNYDGVVNGSDYTLMDNAFNTQGAVIASEVASPTSEIAGSGATSAVPEPATLGLLSVGLIGLLGRRQRRSGNR